jgi:hypothetical protein
MAFSSGCKLRPTKSSVSWALVAGESCIAAGIPGLIAMFAGKISNPRLTERFVREARTIASLNLNEDPHTNICHMHEAGPNEVCGEP